MRSDLVWRPTGEQRNTNFIEKGGQKAALEESKSQYSTHGQVGRTGLGVTVK
jgi:hypothetical protein